MAKARAAMSQGSFQRFVLAICLIFPFGNKILRQLSGWLFGSLDDIGKVAKEMIELRREESSTRRMVLLLLLLLLLLIKLISNECFVLSDVIEEQEIERYNIRKKK